MSGQRFETTEGYCDTAEALSAGMALADPVEIADCLHAFVLPEGAKLHLEDTQKLRDHPRRKTGSRSLATAESFIAYVNAHKTGSTAIYANKGQVNFAAVFNDHEPEPSLTSTTEEDPPTPAGMPDGLKMTRITLTLEEGGAPGWGDFTATYACPLSIEWKRWTSKSQHAAEDKKGMRHPDFIQFIEDNLLDITKPASGAMLAAVRSFEAKQDVKFKSAVRLDNGDTAFAYSEETTGTAVDGRLTLPETFELTIPVFEGGQPYLVEAKLRYRIGGGGLTLWYELVRPHKIIEHAFNEVKAKIEAGIAAVPTYSV